MYWGKDDEGSGHGAYKMVSAKLQLFESDDFAAIYTDAMNSGRIPSIIIKHALAMWSKVRQNIFPHYAIEVSIVEAVLIHSLCQSQMVQR